MRLDWVKERVSQNFLRLVFLPGLINPADCFTKILPVYRHIAALPFLHGTPYLPSTSTHPHPPQPHRNPPTTRPIKSSRCSERQGPPFPSITLAYHLLCFFLLLLFFLNQCIASNKPLPTPVLLSHLHAGTQRTFQPRPRGWMLFSLNLSCFAFVLAYVLHNFTFS